MPIQGQLLADKNGARKTILNIPAAQRMMVRAGIRVRNDGAQIPVNGLHASGSRSHASKEEPTRRVIPTVDYTKVAPSSSKARPAERWIPSSPSASSSEREKGRKYMRRRSDRSRSRSVSTRSERGSSTSSSIEMEDNVQWLRRSPVSVEDYGNDRGSLSEERNCDEDEDVDDERVDEDLQNRLNRARSLGAATLNKRLDQDLQNLVDDIERLANGAEFQYLEKEADDEAERLVEDVEDFARPIEEEIDSLSLQSLGTQDVDLSDDQLDCDEVSLSIEDEPSSGDNVLSIDRHE